MPSLILSSRYTPDSQLLRETARRLGWETFRLDGRCLPDSFEPPDDQIALFYTAPHAFDIAEQLERCLVGCPPDWTVTLPARFLSRHIHQTTLRDALGMEGEWFVKHSVSKAFSAGVYTAGRLAEITADVPSGALVHVGEPVSFEVEYRCFVADHRVVTISPYLRFGQVIEDHSSRLGAPESELRDATEFADAVLACPEVRCPPAFVLDVGRIADRGWAVVEFNECWASGIYACEPAHVLDVLVSACVPATSISSDWDFQSHYFEACG